MRLVRIMKKRAYPETYRPTEEILDNTDVRGFPIVSNDGRRTMMGYIGRTELRYVLGTSNPRA